MLHSSGGKRLGSRAAQTLDNAAREALIAQAKQILTDAELSLNRERAASVGGLFHESKSPCFGEVGKTHLRRSKHSGVDANFLRKNGCHID